MGTKTQYCHIIPEGLSYTHIHTYTYVWPLDQFASYLLAKALFALLWGKRRGFEDNITYIFGTLGGSIFGPFLTTKLGNSSHFLPKCWLQTGLNPIYIYIYTYIYIYIYAVKSIIGPSLAIFKVNNWAKSKSIIGPRSFSHYKNRGFRRFFGGSVIIVCVFFAPNYLAVF